GQDGLETGPESVAEGRKGEGRRQDRRQEEVSGSGMARARIPPETAGQRIDHAVAAAVPGLSVAGARRLLQSGAVRVDGRRLRKGAKIGAREAGAAIEIDDEALAAAGVGARARVAPDPRLALVVLHEDEVLVAVAKPAGVPSH